MMILKSLFTLCMCGVLVQSVTVRLQNGQSSDNLRIEIGGPANLECNYQTTQSSPRVEWIRSDTADASSGDLIYFEEVLSNRYLFVQPSSLRILTLEETDTGFYTCVVTAIGDNPSRASGTYNLTALVPVSMPTCSFPSDLALTLGFSAEFRCQSNKGVPDPQYRWYKNGQLLPENPKNPVIAQYANASFTYSGRTGTLTFSKVSAADAGEYYCEAYNNVGEAKSCEARRITTKDQNVGLIVGIVFAVIFGVLLLGVLIWWTWRKGYCDNVFGKSEPEEVEDDGSNDIMLDGHGPLVHKPPSEVNGSTTGKQEASMMI